MTEEEDGCPDEEHWSCGSMTERHHNITRILFPAVIIVYCPNSPNEHMKYKQIKLLTKEDYKMKKYICDLSPYFFILFCSEGPKSLTNTRIQNVQLSEAGSD